MRTTLIIITLFLSALGHAEPCTIEKNAWGIWTSKDCFINERWQAEIRVQPRLVIELPDLIPIDVNVNMTAPGSGFAQLELKVYNDGVVNSKDFNVRYVVESWRGGQLVRTSAFEETFSALPAKTDRRDVIQQFVQVENDNGNLIKVEVYVDFNGQRSYGDWFEANETNNLLLEECIVDFSDLSDPCDD